MLAKPAKERFFEDYSVGEVYEFGPIALDEAAIVECGFARVETLNQRDEVVATMRAVNFIRRR